MTKKLIELLAGSEDWAKKVTEIGSFDVPVDKYYEKFTEEATELVTDRNEGEMIDAINTLAMLYVKGGYTCTLQDCYDKLAKREERYEAGGPKDIRKK